MIDNYDSFVYNLVRYFQELEEDVYTVRNDKITISDIENLKPMGIIISPGPKSPLESGICLEILEHFKGKIPILGICLGHQCIGHFFGGSVVKGKEPVHGKLSSVTHDNKGIFKGIPNLRGKQIHNSLTANKGSGYRSNRDDPQYNIE